MTERNRRHFDNIIPAKEANMTKAQTDRSKEWVLENSQILHNKLIREGQRLTDNINDWQERCLDAGYQTRIEHEVTQQDGLKPIYITFIQRLKTKRQPTDD